MADKEYKLDLATTVKNLLATKEAQQIAEHPDFPYLLNHPDTKTLVNFVGNKLDQVGEIKKSVVNGVNDTYITPILNALKGISPPDLNTIGGRTVLNAPEAKAYLDATGENMDGSTAVANTLSPMSQALVEAKTALQTVGHNSPSVADLTKVAQQIFKSKQPPADNSDSSPSPSK